MSHYGPRRSVCDSPLELSMVRSGPPGFSPSSPATCDLQHKNHQTPREKSMNENQQKHKREVDGR